MAAFCKDCSIEIFGEDFHDLTHKDKTALYTALCEGCKDPDLPFSQIWVDHTGQRVRNDVSDKWVAEHPS